MKRVSIYMIFTVMILSCSRNKHNYLFLKPSIQAEIKLEKSINNEIYIVINESKMYLVTFSNEIFGEIDVLNTAYTIKDSVDVIGVCHESLYGYHLNEYKPNFKKRISEYYHSYSTLTDSSWIDSGLSDKVKVQIIGFIENNKNQAEILISVKR